MSIRCDGLILCKKMTEHININIEREEGSFYIYGDPEITKYDEPYAEKIKINFCPFCGIIIKEKKKNE